MSSVLVPMSITATSRSSCGEIHREHAGRRIGADVAADDRHAVDAGRWMDRQQATAPGLVRLVVVRLPSAISISVIERYGFWPIEYTFCRKNRSRIVELPTTTTS